MRRSIVTFDDFTFSIGTFLGSSSMVKVYQDCGYGELTMDKVCLGLKGKHNRSSLVGM